MLKYFKQLVLNGSGDNYFRYDGNVNGRNGLILNAVFDNASPLDVSMAFIEIYGISSASYLSFYWDKTGSMTNYSDLNNAEKLDFAPTSNNVLRFDITKVIATLLQERTPTKKQQYIIEGINIPTSGVTCSISIYYEYKMGLKREQATVPFELQTANGSVNLGDGSVSLSYMANSGFGRVPAAVGFVYNSKLTSAIDRVYLANNLYKDIDYKCGRGWKLNFQQYLIVQSATQNEYMNDGESVAYITWVNAQGNRLVFDERLVARINYQDVYLKWSEVTEVAPGIYSYTKNGSVYLVTRNYYCDELYTIKHVANGYEIYDVQENKTTFMYNESTSSANMEIYNIVGASDSYGNSLSVEYDDEGRISLISSVGGNTVEVGYGDDGFVSQIRNIVSDEKTITTSVVHGGELITGFITAENTGDLTITYDSSNNIQTVLDPIGNGYNLVVSGGKVTAIKMIAKNGGIENEQLIPLKNTNNTTTIAGVKYKYINLYEIAYADRYAKLTEKRNSKNSIYLFDYFGRNINTYTNNYDGEGSGNPQSESFAINQPNVEINSQNVFQSNDLCQYATGNSSYFNDLTSISTESERFAMKEFVDKMNSLKEQGKAVDTKVYYASDDAEIDYNKPYSKRVCSIDFTLNPGSVTTIKNGQSLNYVLSCWAMAKAFPMDSLATGYDVIEDNTSEFAYDSSDAFKQFKSGLGTARIYRTFSLYVKINYGTFTDSFTASFDYNNYNFQQLLIPLVIRNKEKHKIQSITVGVNYDNNNGTVYVYGMSLKSGNWNLAQYDNYKLFRYTANKEKEDYWTYYAYREHLLSNIQTTQISSADNFLESDNDNIIKYRVDYTHNEHKRLSKSLDSKGFVVEYTYDTHGDLIDKKSYRTVNDEQTNSYIEKTGYAPETGFVTHEFNQFGLLSQSNVYANGVLKGTTLANSAEISYNYDTDLVNVTKMTAHVPEDPIITDWNYVRNQNTNLSDSGSDVRYDYDGFGRVTNIYLDNELYCSVDYVNERQKTVTYANGEREKINMNKDDTHADIYQTDNPNNWGSTTVEMSFNKYGGFKQLEDNISGTKIKAEYDDRGLPAKMAVENKDDSFYDVIIKNKYDETGRVTTRTYEQENEDIEECNYYYQDSYDGKLTEISHNNIDNEKIIYDYLQRVSRYSKSADYLHIDYTYVNGNDNTTSNLIESEKFTTFYDQNNSDKYYYTYDALGRLTEVKNNGILTKRYRYDLVGRLIREDNRDFEKTFEFVYDKAGNILKRNEYTYTEGVLPVNPVATFNYTYDTTHKNRLLSYNGEACRNYVLGNPKIYRGKTAVWAKVHRLASLGNVSFEYDYAGIRTKKTYNGVTTKYGINGTTIVSQESTTVEDGITTTNRINFFQGFDGVTGFQMKVTKTQKDANGKDVVISVATSSYNYKKNFLGDVIGIYNEKDKLVVKYAYDAWGNCKIIPVGGISNTIQSIFLGTINPYRYRSYYFDTETGLYYLQSRYYDPQVGRFISMDQVEYIDPDVVNGLNLYAYCLNNPVKTGLKGINNNEYMHNDTLGVSNLVGSGALNVNIQNDNHVFMVHTTTSLLVKNKIIASLFGNVSYTKTKQLNESGPFYTYENGGNDSSSIGAGMNFGNWYGVSAYFTSNIGWGTNLQLTPWLTFGSEISLKNGITYSIGTKDGDTTKEISVNIGNGTMLVGYGAAVVVGALPLPGARAVAGVIAGITFLVDIFH